MTTREKQSSVSDGSRTARAFDAERLDRVWATLAHDVREEITAKAQWERVPRAAVIHQWWPDVWAEIAVRA
jgi:hypothetical protein